MRRKKKTPTTRALAFARPGNDFVASNSFWWWWWWSDDADVRGDSASSSSAHRADFGSRTSFAQGGRVGIHGGRGPRRGAPRSSERRRTLGAILDVRRARKRPSRLVREIPVMRERDGTSSMRETKNARATVVSFAQSPCEEHFFFNFQLLRKRRQRRRDETRTGRVFLFLSEPVEVEERGSGDGSDGRLAKEKAACFRGRFSKERKEKEWWLATTKIT